MVGANLQGYKIELERLASTGKEILSDLYLRELERRGKLTAESKERKAKIGGSFEKKYQAWYSESREVLKQILPDRLAEFDDHYRPDPRRKSTTALSYAIQDWMIGIRVSNEAVGVNKFDDQGIVTTRFRAQLEILESATIRFDSRLCEIRQMVQADLFDSELDASRELHNRGFLRAAGAVAGVVLEKHLLEVCVNHNVVLKKKHSTIGELNDQLKNASAIDVPTWRFIQRLGDIRNLCSHNKQNEPSKSDVTELVEGVSRISKTIF